MRTKGKGFEIILGDCVDVAAELEDGSVSLVFADPPYFEIKGEFDFIWPNFEAYKADVRMWAKSWRRILKPSGAVLIYGHALRIAYIQVIFEEEGYHLLNNLVWEKIDAQTKKNAKEEQRRFPPITERALYFERSKELENPLVSVKNDPANFRALRDYARQFLEATGVSRAEAIRRIGQKCDHFFRFDSRQWGLPTEETYQRLTALLPNTFAALSFEELEGSYAEELEALSADVRRNEEARRAFNSHGLFDVLKFSQESNVSGKFKHETPKPPALTRALIETTTRPGELIFVPFGGSGTEADEGIKAGRRVVCSEINEEHYEEIVGRVVREAKAAPDDNGSLTLF